MAAYSDTNNIQVDPADVLRERLSKLMCSKYQLPAMVLNHGKGITIICCCREFERQLRAEIAKSQDPEIKDLKITFLAGDVEFV